MSLIRDIARKIFPYRFRRNAIALSSLLFNTYSQTSFSQEGEDLILRRLIGDKPKGFYVDVGAHHPKLFSNTYFFYKRGWRGINIDAAPGSMRPFKFYRSRDINIESAVSSRTGPIIFTIFNEPALNTFNPGSHPEEKSDQYTACKKVEITPRTLSSLLEEYLPVGQEIDFLSIDVEEEDVYALKSNNWIKFRPSFVLIEDRNFDLENPMQSQTFIFLKSKRYTFKAKTLNTLIFQRLDIDPEN